MIIDRDGALLGRAPGLPDEAYLSDGLLTKRVVRASALAHLRIRRAGSDLAMNRQAKPANGHARLTRSCEERRAFLGAPA